MKKVKKVMVFGVFDLLHPGHLDFLMQASELGENLVVSVARDLNVFKIKEQKPIHSELERLNNLSILPFVSKAMLGGLKDPWPHIAKEKPDIIALGYDQTSYVAKKDKDEVRRLEEELQSHGLKKTKVVRLKPHWPQIYKSKIIRAKLEK